MSKLLKYSILPFLILAVLGCSDSGSDQINKMAANDQAYLNSLDEIKNIFYMIPSPMETSILLKKAGAEYDYSLLNDPNNISKYDTQFKQAVNLGIYSADLSYATLFDQIQDIRFYITSSKSLAEELGIMKAFDQQMIDRVENNLEDKDSMMLIVSEIYWIADAHLKETDNVLVSSLLLYGGWIESFYLSTSLYGQDPKNNALKQRITEQKHTLDNLVALLTKTTFIDEQIHECVRDLKRLQKTYNAFQFTEEEPKLVEDKKTGINTITGKSEIQMNAEQFNSLFELVKEIRSKNIH